MLVPRELGFLFIKVFFCLFVGLIYCLAKSSTSTFQTAQGHAFFKLFYAAGAVTVSVL